eukprot:TRINITY_DN16441_c0_g1_i1.p1 TRINITY_DN16441_c0_g1~~TRINITY_DN16441_c0_g1_i1.p1  ORF type:complete len:333 (-),score=61.19 TRINITY_DN16441_c0_g1_i1:204-1202(-)
MKFRGDAISYQLCQSLIVKDAEVNRMSNVLKAALRMGTDVLFLNEIPIKWLKAGFADKALSKGFRLHQPKKLDKKDNTIVLLKTDVFPEGSVTKLEEDETYKSLVLTATPKGMTAPLQFVGLHLASDKNENEARKKGVDSFAHGKLAVIAASDTNGDPRNKDYKAGKYFYEDLLRGTAVHRATNSPWGKKAGSDEFKTIPDYGTCNKMRTPMQYQVAKANELDRLMKDNIYYKDGEGVVVEQLDLCDTRKESDCKDYTFGGRVHCFGQDGRYEDEVIGGQSDSFPVTCGYVGPETFLPNLATDWGLSDHMAVTAKFRVSAAMPPSASAPPPP